MRGQVHIAFHYKESRVPILQETIRLIKSWEDETDVFVHTNNPDFTLYGVITIQWEKLDHPFLLTLMPLLYIQKTFHENTCDFFVYTEDDIGISNESYKYWKRHPYPETGFIRVAGDILFDLEKLPTVENNSFIFNMLYKAFWINTREQMYKFLEEVEHVKFDVLRNIEWSRERCAYGNVPTHQSYIIPFDEFENTLVEHLGNEETAKKLMSEKSHICKYTIKQLRDIITNANSHQ